MYVMHMNLFTGGRVHALSPCLEDPDRTVPAPGPGLHVQTWSYDPRLHSQPEKVWTVDAVVKWNAEG